MKKFYYKHKELSALNGLVPAPSRSLAKAYFFNFFKINPLPNTYSLSLCLINRNVLAWKFVCGTKFRYLAALDDHLSHIDIMKMIKEEKVIDASEEAIWGDDDKFYWVCNEGNGPTIYRVTALLNSDDVYTYYTYQQKDVENVEPIYLQCKNNVRLYVWKVKTILNGHLQNVEYLPYFASDNNFLKRAKVVLHGERLIMQNALVMIKKKPFYLRLSNDDVWYLETISKNN